MLGVIFGVTGSIRGHRSFEVDIDRIRGGVEDTTIATDFDWVGFTFARIAILWCGVHTTCCCAHEVAVQWIPLQTDEAVFTPALAPGILDKPVQMFAFFAIAEACDSMVDVPILGFGFKDAFRIRKPWVGSN